MAPQCSGNKNKSRISVYIFNETRNTSTALSMLITNVCVL